MHEPRAHPALVPAGHRGPAPRRVLPARGQRERDHRACDPPSSFFATWEYGGEVSWIEVGLSTEDEGTRFEIEHIAHVDDTRWSEFGPGAVGVGWDLAVMALALHMSSGAAVDPTQAAAWLATDEGRELMTRSSELWRDASIAAGADEAEATAAGDRTTAAYAGEPEEQSAT